MSIGTSPDTAAGFVDPSPQEIPPATIGIFGKQAKETTGNSQFLSLLSAKLLAQLSSWVFKSATAKASKSMTACQKLYKMQSSKFAYHNLMTGSS
jgi:hypothetical protein